MNCSLSHLHNRVGIYGDLGASLPTSVEVLESVLDSKYVDGRCDSTEGLSDVPVLCVLGSDEVYSWQNDSRPSAVHAFCETVDSWERAIVLAAYYNGEIRYSLPGSTVTTSSGYKKTTSCLRGLICSNCCLKLSTSISQDRSSIRLPDTEGPSSSDNSTNTTSISRSSGSFSSIFESQAGAATAMVNLVCADVDEGYIERGPTGSKAIEWSSIIVALLLSAIIIVLLILVLMQFFGSFRFF